MSDNRELRRMFAPKREDVREEWTKLHEEELNRLYFSPDFTRIIKAMMRWVVM
jgi:hypothetical protein